MSVTGRKNAMTAANVVLEEAYASRGKVKEYLKDGKISRTEGFGLLGMFFKMVFMSVLSIMAAEAQREE